MWKLFVIIFTIYKLPKNHSMRYTQLFETRTILGTFSTDTFFDLTLFQHKDLFQNVESVWEALCNIEAYFANQKLGKIEVSVPPTAYLVNPELISIGEGTVIEPGAYIKGPCIIGKNCHIRHAAYIRGYVLIGDYSVVGHTTEIKHSIMLNHAHAAHFAYIGDSIIGNYVNLGAGTKCANLRLNGKSISVRHGKELVATHLRKFGAIIGDHSQIGCNVVLNPGSVLGKSVHSHPSLNFGGFIPEKSLIKSTVQVDITAQI
ncbi:MAG: hypothetical protein JWO53_248 [Chlamydiia bacterium]|nr:hypothetical protein [Chlamydiia bacterium]